MSDEGQRLGSAHSVSLAKRVLGPRPVVLTAAAVCVVGVVLALALLVVSSQDASRKSAEERFANGAVVRGQLTSALLSTSSSSLRATALKTAPNPKALQSLATKSRLGYAAILSSSGEVLAVSSGAPPSTAARLATRPAHVRQALAGRAWISGVQPALPKVGSLVDIAIPFPSSSGRRVLVEGVPTKGLAPFLTSFLSQGTAGRAVYVIDTQRQLIAASKGAPRASATRLPAALATASDLSSRKIGPDFVASAGVAGTSWQIVVSQPTSSLYPGITGSRSWLLWAVVLLAGAVGLASLIPLRRSQVRTAQLAAAHTEVTVLNASLEARVTERTELAERRAHALARSNAELEQFASVAAHDLQEPLRKIRMYCERLERRREEIPEEVQGDVMRMEAAAGRMQNLISDLLDLARVNSRGRELVAIDLAEVAHEVMVDLEARVSEVGATIEIGELPVVVGDGVQLRQILQNLVSNALKFHRPDVPLHVRVTSEPSERGRCTITVQDNGIGFDEKYAERIFGTFQRLHGRAEYEGTGIGLSIARKIAWRHDGDITATGVAGEGAAFRLTLPLAQGAAAATPATTPRLVPERANERTAA